MTNDPSTMMSLLGLATQAIPFVKSIADVAGDAKTKDATSQLFDRLIAIQKLALDGQQATAEMQQKIAQVTAELERYRDWESTASRYELHKTGAGAIVYSQKATADVAEPLHYLCPNCFAKRQKSFLQPVEFCMLHCKPCSLNFYLTSAEATDYGYTG